MTNIKKLIKMLEEMEDGEFKDSLLQCASDIEDDQQELVDEVDNLKSELDSAETEISNLSDQPEFISENLGLDTINYYLEKGNLKVSQQLESAFNLIKS